MSGRDAELTEARRALAAAGSIDQLRRLLGACAPRFHEPLMRRVAAGMRPDLGMQIATMPGRAGFTSRAADSFFVSLGSKAGTAERRFTLAHELAHTLLDDVDREALALERSDEEDLCDLFARRALAPPPKVRRYIGSVGYPRNLEGLSAFVRAFGISLRAGIVALDEFCPDSWPVAFIGASWRAHPRGDQVLGVRIDASTADRRLFFPSHCRVGTLGFKALEAWVIEAAPGDRARGSDSGLELRSRQRGVPAWTGSGSWSAHAHLLPGGSLSDPGRGLLACLSVSALQAVAPKRRPARSLGDSSRVVSPCPGQLCLD